MTAREIGRKTDMKALSACFDAALEYIQAMPSKQKPLLLPEIGQLVVGEGVYLGQYKPVDRDGNSLKKTFNVFAAPEDLTGGARTYVDTVKAVAGLRNWHGHDGTGYATDKELYAAIRNRSYRGDWVIPTRDILSGKDVDGNATTPDNIFVHRDKGAFEGTLEMSGSYSGSDYSEWYWSLTAYRDYSSTVWYVRLSDGTEGWSFDSDGRFSCRPVRLVEVKP